MLIEQPDKCTGVPRTGQSAAEKQSVKLADDRRSVHWSCRTWNICFAQDFCTHGKKVSFTSTREKWERLHFCMVWSEQKDRAGSLCPQRRRRQLHLQFLGSNFNRKSKEGDKVSDKHSATVTGHTVQKETWSFISLLLRPLHISALDSGGRPGLQAERWMFSHLREDERHWSDLTLRLEAKTLLIGNKKAGWATATAERSASFSLVVSCVWSHPEAETQSLLQFFFFFLIEKNRRLRERKVLILAWHETL